MSRRSSRRQVSLNLNDSDSCNVNNDKSDGDSNALQLLEPLLQQHHDDRRDADNNGLSSSSYSSGPEEAHIDIIIIDGLPKFTSRIIKCLYFVEALNSTTWGRFGTIYYNLHKMNSYQIGILESTMTIIPIVSIPTWGIICDLYNCQKQIYILTKFMGTITILSLSLPYVYNSHFNIFVVSCLTKLFVQNILDTYTLTLCKPPTQDCCIAVVS